jgi:hypothetical protein
MGTFHQGKCELHGITVVVDTTGAEVFVGRCDDMDERGIVLDDVDVHRDGEEGRSKEQYVKRAALYGVFKKYDRLFIPKDKVASIQRLGKV